MHLLVLAILWGIKHVNWQKHEWVHRNFWTCYRLGGLSTRTISKHGVFLWPLERCFFTWFPKLFLWEPRNGLAFGPTQFPRVALRVTVIAFWGFTFFLGQEQVNSLLRIKSLSTQTKHDFSLALEIDRHSSLPGLSNKRQPSTTEAEFPVKLCGNEWAGGAHTPAIWFGSGLASSHYWLPTSVLTFFWLLKRLLLYLLETALLFHSSALLCCVDSILCLGFASCSCATSWFDGEYRAASLSYILCCEPSWSITQSFQSRHRCFGCPLAEFD